MDAKDSRKITKEKECTGIITGEQVDNTVKLFATYSNILNYHGLRGRPIPFCIPLRDFGHQEAQNPWHDPKSTLCHNRLALKLETPNVKTRAINC
ncbi:hypothetical protein [Staphylococcus phage vB_SauH_DELF3]|nr:hypothetical protein [Staphylococcus phage vB_SauH_DELF3]